MHNLLLNTHNPTNMCEQLKTERMIVNTCLEQEFFKHEQFAHCCMAELISVDAERFAFLLGMTYVLLTGFLSI